jgi:hypothetical protein
MAVHIDDQITALLRERRAAAEQEADRLRREIAGQQAALDELELYLHGLEIAEGRHGKEKL